jgi:cell division transport system ATP-binding protein
MIRFDHVSQIYRGTKRPALNAVDLEILRGEFVFLVGASGSGKSSFLRLVLKEDKPTSGRIHVLGQDLGAISSRKVPYFRRNLGVVFQDFRLLPNKNVFDNVAFTLQVIGKSRGFIQEAVPDVLAMVGLNEKANRLPHELSGGEQQRVAIARAVVNKPAILLADEPTGNLDPLTSAGIMQVLQRINAGGTTVIMATHDNAIVDQMQRRVIELVTGEVVRDERGGGYGMTAEIALRDSGMTAEIGIPEGLTRGSRGPDASQPTFTTPQTVATAPEAAPAPERESIPVQREAVRPAPLLPDTTAAVPVQQAAPLPPAPLLPAPVPPAPLASAPLPPVPGSAPQEPAFRPPEELRPQFAPPPPVSPVPPAQPLQPAPAAFIPQPISPASSSHEEDPHPATGELSLAEKLGLRAPGEKLDPTKDQNVGPTS